MANTDVDVEFDETMLDSLVDGLVTKKKPKRTNGAAKVKVNADSSPTESIRKNSSMPNFIRHRGSATKKKKRRGRLMQPLMDIEEFEVSLQRMKKRCAELDTENMQLKAAKARQEAKLAQKDREIEVILKKAIAEGDPSGNRSALMHEKMLVSSLQSKCKQLYKDLRSKKDELDHIKSQLKFSQLHELQIIVQEYYNEILRLRKFNELGREPDAHTKLSVLTELKRLRSESTDLHAENTELNHRITELELQTEHTMKMKQKSYLDQIHKLELQLRNERSKASELEQLGDMSRKQLDQVITSTEGTRKAIDEYAGQISLLKAKLKTKEIELEQVKNALTNMEAVHSSELDKIVSSNQTVMNTTNKELAHLKVEVERLRIQSRTADDALNVEKEQLAAELGIANAGRQRAERALETLKSSREMLEKEMAQSMRDRNEESSELRAKIESLEQEIATLRSMKNAQDAVEREQKGHGEEEMNATFNELQKLKGQHQLVCDELTVTMEQYESLKSKLLQSEQELDVIKKHISEHKQLRQAGEEHRQEADAAQKELEKLKDEEYKKMKSEQNQSNQEQDTQPQVDGEQTNQEQTDVEQTEDEELDAVKEAVEEPVLATENGAAEAVDSTNINTVTEKAKKRKSKSKKSKGKEASNHVDSEAEVAESKNDTKKKKKSKKKKK